MSNEVKIEVVIPIEDTNEIKGYEPTIEDIRKHRSPVGANTKAHIVHGDVVEKK